MGQQIETHAREAVSVEDAATITMMGFPVIEALPSRCAPYELTRSGGRPLHVPMARGPVRRSHGPRALRARHARCKNDHASRVEEGILVYVYDDKDSNERMESAPLPTSFDHRPDVLRAQERRR